ncbi:hypothetical protein LCGC14_0693170 [marine sediment metagenome]|uniref:Uncharacterized protein n=1 Tax=marine sediment metagenome TaxID=412755 RepID=A0A0F9T668_9ZZZZ
MPKPLQAVEPQEMGCQALISDRLHESRHWPGVRDMQEQMLRYELRRKGCENIQIQEPERFYMDPWEDEDPESLTFGEKFEGCWMWEINAVGERHAS